MPKILVIDDHPTNREFLVTLLAYGGNTLLEASDGAEGIAVSRAQQPDLVIADIVMPEMDGYAFVRQLRAEPAIAGTPVIFYTASYLEDAARKLAEACGVTRILVKPSDPEEILATVNEALGSRAGAAAPVVSESFDREHLSLVTNKLSEKVNELEILNAQLEERVATRTAELAAANAGLRDLSRMKDEFLAVVSHDLRSPLSGIEMMSGLLGTRGRTLSPKDFDRLVETIRDASHHLLEMVGDLMDIAKIEAGQAMLELGEVLVGDVIRGSVKALGFNANAKNIAIELESPPDERPLNADRLKLSQVFSNLLGNAIKFTPQDGRVRVAVAHAADGVTVRIADSGSGIPAEALAHLFDKLSPARRIGTAGERGAGLGLSIVRQLVELHGGRIEAESELGLGSTFTVHLPFAPGARPPANSP